MIWVENRTFCGEDVKLDYSRWRRCDFIDCAIIIEAGVFDLVECDFTRCRLVVTGHARDIITVCKLFFPEIPTIDEKVREHE